MTAEPAGDPGDGYCGETVRRTIDLVGGKWTMLILWELLGSECRYAELQRRVAGVSQKVLSGELKALVAAGLVDREVVPSVPPQVTYRITEEGRSLEEVFAVLHRWGLRLEAEVAGAPRWVVLKPAQAPHDADSPGSAGITASCVAS